MVFADTPWLAGGESKTTKTSALAPGDQLEQGLGRYPVAGVGEVDDDESVGAGHGDQRDEVQVSAGDSGVADRLTDLERLVSADLGLGDGLQGNGQLAIRAARVLGERLARGVLRVRLAVEGGRRLGAGELIHRLVVEEVEVGEAGDVGDACFSDGGRS